MTISWTSIPWLTKEELLDAPLLEHLENALASLTPLQMSQLTRDQLASLTLKPEIVPVTKCNWCGSDDPDNVCGRKFNGMECKMPKAIDTQVAGDHYKDMKIQPFEYSLANGLGPAEHSVLKYISRWKNKGGIADLEKAQHILQILIEHEEQQ